MILHCKCCVWGSQKCTFFVWGGHIWDPLLVWFRNILRVKIWLMGSFERCAENWKKFAFQMRPPMGYLGDGRLGLNFGRNGRFDSEFFGKWEIDSVKEQRNGRNGKIRGSTYLGAGKLAVIKVGDGRLSPPPIMGPRNCIWNKI